MNLDEKYLGKIKFPNDTVKVHKNGKDAYAFPCPNCSSTKTQSGKLKPKKRTAILMYSQDSERYVFKCLRCKTSGNLLNFLLLHQPYLAEKYKAEKNRHYVEPDLPYNFKPNFNA